MIVNLIQQIPNWAELDAQEIADLLNTPTITVRDSQLYTYAGIIDKIGTEAGFAFRATVRYLSQSDNPATLPAELFEPLNFAHERLAGGGIDLSRPDVQSLLDVLTVIPNLEPFIPAVKEIGVYQVSVVTKAKLNPVQPADVEAGLLEIRKKVLEDDAINRLQAYREALSVWDGESQEPVL